ncbi:LuxR C-terminal-related transcriptional regulator [Streptomyces sp. NPDC088755]|uniref:LuxR C-terminal-related transcriptional regulator n=1 Tax=Streptomyces sp. NPDC088755 TaxID=3365888 RepID=UPI0037F921DD
MSTDDTTAFLPWIQGPWCESRTRGSLRLVPFPPRRRVVQCLAVLGRDVPLQRLWSLVEQDEDLLGIVEASVEAGWVTWSPGEGRVGVVRAVRADVIAAMTPSEAEIAYRWAARWSQGATSLLHRAAAVRGADEYLARRLEAAAHRSGAQGQVGKAAELLSRAADISADTALAAGRETASTVFALRAHDLARVRRSLSVMRQDEYSTFRHALAGRLAVLENRIEEGASLLGEACRELRHAGGAGSQDLQAAVVQWAAHARWLAGDPVERIGQQLKELDAPALRDPYWVGERQRLEAVLTSSAEGPAKGLRALAAGSAVALSASAEVRGRSAVTEAWLHLETGDLDRCEAAASGALIAVSLDETSHVAEAVATIRGHALWLRGAWKQAEVCGRSAARSSSPLWRSRGRALLALVAASRGVVQRNAAIGGQEPETSVLGAAAQLFTALVAAEATEGTDGVGLLAAAEYRLGREVLSGPLLPWRKVELVRAATTSGYTRLAATLITSMRADAHGAPPWVQGCLSWMEALSAARTGSRDSAARLYARVDEVAAAFEATAPWYYARYQADHAEFLAAVGDRRAAVDRLRAARAVADRIGAKTLVNRCATRLRTLRVPMNADVFGLTARETEVAELVSTGLTNGEVAGRLFVTPAAVAFHLGNVYRKLGVRSRYELRRWWNERHAG